MRSRPSPAGNPGRKQRRAATAIEYLFCMSLILVVCIAVVRTVGSALKSSFSNSAQKIEKITPGK